MAPSTSALSEIEVIGGRRVLIISASMGAGHDGAAKELKQRLEVKGHDAEIKDFLAAFPIGIGWFFRWLYGRMLALAPWTYDALYWVFPSVYKPFEIAEHKLTSPTLRKWIRQYKPDVIVSTYPLMSIALGHMRMRGKLDIPVITYITDFHVHRMVTHEGVDLHLAVHDLSKTDAMKSVTGAVKRCAPLVSSTFAEAAGSRNAMRIKLGIDNGQTMVLVVAGSWGAGEVEATVVDLAESNLVPVVVCGKNQELVERLEAHEGVHAIGWTKEMPELMAAADVLVDNAGGLTAMEALAAGLPIVNYRPLAGHGRDNAIDMETAGVVTVAHTRHEFIAALTKLGTQSDARATQIANGQKMFDVDATDDVLAYASGIEVPLADVIALKERPHQKRRHRVKRTVMTAAATMVALSIGLTTGVGAATAHGIGGDRPGKGDDGTYLGVRVTGDQLADPQILNALKTMPITLVVDGPTAEAHTTEVRDLVASGVEIANGGSGQRDPGWQPWSRARLDLQTATTQLDESTGTKVRIFTPCRRLDGFDMLYSKRMHMAALPTAKKIKIGTENEELAERGVYILDGRRQSTDAFEKRLLLVQDMLTSRGIHVQPLASLV